jgi:1A family penicillin-binding protein
MRKVVSYHKPKRRWNYWAAFITLTIAVPIVTLGAFASADTPLFKLPSKENFHPTQTIFYDRNGVKLYETSGAHQPTPVQLNQVPRSLVLATLAAEDSDFYKHRGVNPVAIARAAYKNVFTDEQQGGSTITQQLIKNTYLSSDRTASRKLREMSYAIVVEQRYSKDEILERYLNEVYYGQQSYGVQDAAKTYFGKDINQLTLGEASMLAGIANAPSLYSPVGGNPKAAKSRQEYVLDRMTQLGYITKDQATAAAAEQLTYAQSEQVFHAPHFVFYVKDELSKYYGSEVVDSGGLKVYTTLDLAKQEAAEEEVRKGVASVRGYGATNGALVAQDPRNGEVLAMVGSADFANDQIDGKVNVATAERQPGSSFKPFVYAAAIKSGMGANTVLHDKPTTFYNTFRPQNYDGGYHGNVTLRYALGNSLNIPSVELLDKVGTAPSLDLAHQMGISTLNDPSRYGLSLVLGGGEVKLLDMTTAYSVFANNGTQAGRATVTKVLGPDGKPLYERKPQPKQVMDPGIAYIMTDILSDNSARAIGFGPSSPLVFPRPAAVKTGTTNNYKDNWTVGYTPQLVVGVWVGNNDGTPMRGISGVQGAAPIWNSTMQKLLAGQPVEKFTPPGDVYRSCACVNAIGGRAQEYFLRSSAAKPGNDNNAESTPAAGNGRFYIDTNGRRVYY